MKDPTERRRLFLRVRVLMLASLIVLGACAVVHRAWDLQVRRASVLREMAEEQYLRDVNLTPKRGSIYDRRGAELAVSVDVDSVWANPAAIKKQGHDPRAIASRLSELLGVDAEVITQRLSSSRHFVWIKRRVTPAQGKAIRALRLPGVSISEESRRFYPNRELAAHVLGFANVDGVGIDGIELQLEETLRGPEKKIPAVLDRRGEVVFSERLLDDRAARGDEVLLTIDKTIQHIAERELELAVRTSEARAGTIVVIDPSTGELIALANYPTFNPNEPGKAKGAERRNRAITDRFEPGSTIKPFTIAGALARGAVSPTQKIACEDGAMRVAQYTIHDTHRWAELTPGQIIAVSSNIGTAKVGVALGRAGLHDVLTRFGFGQPTGIGLPGETSGILRHHKRWYEMDAATISFGQGMSTTAVQLAMAMGALANKGRLMEPLIVKRIVDPQGVVVHKAVPRVRRQVVPESIARLVSDMMVGVTSPGGTATEAAIEGHLVAGKTGTAQKADYVRGGYAKDKWTSSFVGYVPAQKPRLLAAVILDEPIVAHQGGSVAAPAFRRVMSASLRHLGVAADAKGSLSAQLSQPKLEAIRETRELPSVPDEAEADSAQLAVPEGQVRVPSVLGQSARAAVVAFRKSELDLRLQGTGLVVAQDPPALSVVPRGTTVQVQLEPRRQGDERSSELALETRPAPETGTVAVRAKAAAALEAKGGHGG